MKPRKQQADRYLKRLPIQEQRVQKLYRTKIAEIFADHPNMYIASYPQSK